MSSFPAIVNIYSFGVFGVFLPGIGLPDLSGLNVYVKMLFTEADEVEKTCVTVILIGLLELLPDAYTIILSKLGSDAAAVSIIKNTNTVSIYNPFFLFFFKIIFYNPSSLRFTFFNFVIDMLNDKNERGY